MVLVGQSVVSVCFWNPSHVGKHLSVVTLLHSFGKDKYYCMVGKAKQRGCDLKGSEPRLLWEKISAVFCPWLKVFSCFYKSTAIFLRAKCKSLCCFWVLSCVEAFAFYVQPYSPTSRLRTQPEGEKRSQGGSLLLQPPRYCQRNRMPKWGRECPCCTSKGCLH